MTDQCTWLNIVQVFGPLLVAIVVTVANFWHNDRQRQREATDKEMDRQFTIKRKVSERALDVIGESYRLVHDVNECALSPGSQREDLVKKIDSAWDYWKTNMFYLPKTLSSRIIRLKNLSYASIENAASSEKTMEEVQEFFKGIEVAFDQIMEEYNLFYELKEGSES